MKIITIFILLVFSIPSFAQNLLNERIWKLVPRKRAVFVDKGIFHAFKGASRSTLIALRHHYNKNQKFERVVFDFNTDNVPNIYGHISRDKNKIFVDLFNTAVNSNLSSFGDSHFVANVDVYPITSKMLPVEISLKEAAKVDVFYLKSKGRLVFDIRKN